MEAVSRTGRGPRRRRVVAVLVALLATIAGLLVAAGSAQAVTVAPVNYTDLGTNAPPATMGGYVMTPFGTDGSGNVLVSTVPSPLSGNVGLSPSLIHYTVPATWNNWSNGYTGDVYGNTGITSDTLTLPAGTAAFYFYVEGNNYSTYNITATTDNGSTITKSVSTPGGARGFGFSTNDNSTISTIAVTVPAGANGFAVGEFGISAQLTAAPVFTSVGSTTFTAGTAGTYTVTTLVDAAHGVAKLTCSGSIACSIFTDNGDGTATLSGTPASTAGGVYIFTIKAKNHFGTTNQTFTLTVNQSPTLTGNTSPSFTVGSFGSYTYTATGYPGVPTISISSGSLPTGLSLAAPVSSTNGNGDKVTTVNLQGTPAAGTGNTYNVQLVAANGTLPDATLNITITVYEAPHITSAPHTTFIALQYNSFQVTASGGYPPSPLTFSATGLPAGVHFTSGGLLYGTPPVSASGYHHITITVSNGVVSSSQDFVLFIHAPAIPAGSMADPGGLNVTSISATGECLTWTMTGYAPYAPVTVIAYPRLTHAVPYNLGTHAANFAGKITLNLCLPDSARGSYTLLAAGYATSGNVLYQEARTIVQPL